MRHIHLTAHFQKLRCILQLFGNLPDGFDIGRHVFADHTVAAGGSPHQRTVFVFKAARKAIDLDLHHVFRFDACFTHPAVKVAQFVKRKRIQQTFHFDRVCDLGKPSAGGPANMLRR